MFNSNPSSPNFPQRTELKRISRCSECSGLSERSEFSGCSEHKGKKSTEQYLLYGCDRTDAVMRTKTKKVPSKEFAMGY